MDDSTRTVTFDASLVAEAEECGVDIAVAAETAIRDAVKDRQAAQARAEAWKRENREGIEWYNNHIRENGLFLKPLWEQD